MFPLLCVTPNTIELWSDVSDSIILFTVIIILMMIIIIIIIIITSSFGL